MELERILSDMSDGLKRFKEKAEKSSNLLEFNECWKGEVLSEDIVRLGLHMLLDLRLRKELPKIIKDSTENGRIQCNIEISIGQ